MSQLPTATGTFIEHFPRARHRAKHSTCITSFDAAARSEGKLYSPV